ncbi:major facilitator superfamily domain-containing protein [Suillus fuscotomentosus]|uniref:Major facilitator superfamily domain-containing protein n=1 Tax=Suillus fuscotomentosus TaxID=1912939 RepID=A0AAD4E050_9AGAM|nr:major facilitator superfamily domain-containing protein [Suillus fuscotomentosus]KAG1896882.1 major facilitator superfamily domain-containing protein [Suillus fuscotomentosus]
MSSLRNDSIESKSEKQIVLNPSPRERARILRKIDWHLLPLVTVFYLFSYLDRAIIGIYLILLVDHPLRSSSGYAKVGGMATNLHLTGFRYNIAAAVFFIPHGFAEVPSNIALKLLRPSRWIPSIMVAWGIVSTLMCLVRSYQSLVVARVFLGLTEAGLFPGVNYYICLWYPRSERSKRIAIFFSSASVAGAFSGLLAYGIERMEGVGGLHGWQWIFCLEGTATVLVATLSFFFMHDYPETAKFLTESERSYIIDVLKQDSNNLSSRFDTQFVWQAIKDYKTYVLILVHIGYPVLLFISRALSELMIRLLVPGFAISLFTPTIINELGYSAAHAQLLSVPPFAAGCIATIIVGIYSDKHNLRGPYIIGGALVSLVGYILLYCSVRAGPSYVGVCLAATGYYPTIPIIMAWTGSNAGGDLKRGVVLAMVGFSNLGGICSSFIYIDPPRFHLGHGTIMGFLSLAIITSLFAMWDYNRLNKKKEAQCLAENIGDDREYEFEDMGDTSPLFRYTI